jgi:hypothetical protein
MNRLTLHKWKFYILLGLVLALAITIAAVTVSPGQSSPRDNLPCGVDGVTCPLVGDFDPLSVEPAPGAWQVSGPGAPAFGALVYDPDYKLIEEKARAKLSCGLGVREALSPYRGNLPFEEYLKKFDYEVGWDTETEDLSQFADLSCFGPNTDTLTEVVDDADANLREARDLYAYLAVYAPEYRFRLDSEYIGGDPLIALCGATDKEDPDPVDPANSGLVLDPVIDWCHFKARLRQSVREAANLRLLFGQQFMVDAMGLHFSGVDFVGGENAVRQELAQLRAAKHQYEKAETGLAEALGRGLGSGCYVSDFYTQSEWSLLSRAIQNQETAQHHIAIRLSYMDIASPESVPQVHAQAMQAFRQASVDGYIKLIGMASLEAAQPLGVGCDVGERPDGLLAAEMAANLIETRRRAREMDEGRNIFGFDVTFTPARPYKSSVPTTCDEASAGDRGLWDEAWCAAEYAKELQNDEVDNTRAFDDSQEALQTEMEEIRSKFDARVGNTSGCYRTDFTDDDSWYACVTLQINELPVCLLAVNEDVVNIDEDTDFEECMENEAIKNGEARQALYDLRVIRLSFKNIRKKTDNIANRINLSNDRNAIVEQWLINRAGVETAARVAQAAAQQIECWDENAIACSLTGATNAVAQAVAGAMSGVASVKMEDAEYHKETQNLLLDQSELLIEAYAVQEQSLSKEAEFTNQLDGLIRDLDEAKRARAYFQHSPANDPSYRMVRDSSRLVLAKQMEYAARMAYLAARRAEYEYAARLSASNFRISDIYRSRTADDIKRYLTSLLGVTNNLAGSATYQTNADDFTISVAQHVLLLTDEALAKEGIPPENYAAVRTQRFRAWVAENTINDPDISSKPVLKFPITTSLLDGGLFSQVIQEGYDRYWLLKLSGIAEPKADSNGIMINLVSDQAGLSYRTVALTQGGLVHLRSFAGCTFDYRLLAPAALLGLEWASNQDPEAATAVWNANVNATHDYTENGFRTPTFLSRAVSSTDWEVLMYSGAPVAGMPDMDLQQLTDIELIFSTTYASREPGDPQPSECTRIDW